MGLLDQDPDKQALMQEQRRRERELRLAKRQAIKQGRRDLAFDLGEYGRANGIDQRTVRDAGQLEADAMATVRGARQELAFSSAMRKNAMQRLLTGTSAPAGAGAAAKEAPNQRTTLLAPSNRGGTALATLDRNNIGTPEEQQRARAQLEEALGGGGEFQATAMYPGMSFAPGSNGMSATTASTDRVANPGVVQNDPANRTDRLATPRGGAKLLPDGTLQAPGPPVPGSTPATSGIYPSDPAAAPAAPAPAPAPAGELFLNPGEAAPEGYVLVGARSGKFLYRNDADSVAAEAAAKETSMRRGSIEQLRDDSGRTLAETRLLTPKPGQQPDLAALNEATRQGDVVRAGAAPARNPGVSAMDPTTRAYYEQRLQKNAAANEQARRNSLTREQRYAEDVQSRGAQFDQQYGVSNLPTVADAKAGVEAARAGGTDDQYAEALKTLRLAQSRDLFTKYGIKPRHEEAAPPKALPVIEPAPLRPAPLESRTYLTYR